MTAQVLGPGTTILGGLLAVLLYALSKFIEVWLSKEWDSIAEAVYLTFETVGVRLIPSSEREDFAEEARGIYCGERDRCRDEQRDFHYVTEGLKLLAGCVRIRTNHIRRAAVAGMVLALAGGGLMFLRLRYEPPAVKFKWLRVCVRIRRGLSGGQRGKR